MRASVAYARRPAIAVNFDKTEGIGLKAEDMSWNSASPDDKGTTETNRSFFLAPRAKSIRGPASDFVVGSVAC